MNIDNEFSDHHSGGMETRAEEGPFRLNTWETIIAQFRRIGDYKTEEERIDVLVELLVNLRLLGLDSCIPDRREKKGDIETLYAGIESETRLTLDAVSEPSDKFIYYAREVLKKLPVRQGAEEMIERIRAEAEAFEESRSEDDPLKGFAGDLRKEVHRRLSPKIIANYIEPYLQLAVHGNPEPIVRAGYVALPSRFSAEEESRDFIDLATDLLERLNYLWDYEAGDLAAVKKQLAANLGLFERCFLKAEVEGFLELLTPENLGKPLLELDLLKRLASFKHFLKESYREGRIGLYDLLLLDLSVGRLIFLLANDLTNNHFSEVGPRNVRDALAVIHELLNISSIKGLAIGDVVRHQKEIEELCEASVFDFIKAKRCLGSICNELQRYLQSDIIDRMSGILNRALESYGAPTSKLSSIKTRFFNNFIRRTQLHVLSEFTDKVAAAVDRELERQSEGRQLYSEFKTGPGGGRVDPRACIAATWRNTDKGIRPFLGGKGNSVIDMALLGLRVPPAFVLGYPLLADCADKAKEANLSALVKEELGELERQSGRRLGDPAHPLIVSVRSGAPTSMPGVMATILNVGLSPAVRFALAERRGAALIDTLYRRFLENCASALALLSARDAEPRESGDQGQKRRNIADLESLIAAALGQGFLTDPGEQLIQCIRLVYGSRGSRAVRAYSKTLATNVRTETAVTVQQVVFGNLNARSLSGVLITRNPITGEDKPFGEFKRQAQGEEVVMGSAHSEAMADLDPEIAAELGRCKELLVGHFRQDLDLEFTVEDGRLYLLQARAAKLGAFANLVADTDFLSRGLIDLGQYRERLDRLEMANAFIALPRADFRSRRWNPPLTVGVPINSGVVSGTLVLSQERLKEAENRRESVVYFANTTKPTDFAVMNGAHAIVTVYPGRTSHAAITAMAMNKPCIVGCGDVEIDYENRRVLFHAAGLTVLREGERVTADGNTGAIYRGIAPISEFFLPLSSVGAAVEGCSTAPEAARAVRALLESRLASLNRETNLHRMTLDEVDSFQGCNVLVRVDANIDMRRNREACEQRLLQMVPTLKSILEKGGTPVVCSHLGDPGAANDVRLSREEIYRDYSLRPIAESLKRWFGEGLVFHTSSVAASGLLIAREGIVPGTVNLLENLRFATGEKDNDDAFARSLAGLSGGWYVNDAFNVCLRRHASITGVPKFVRHRLAGPVVARELSILETLLDEPPRPFVAVFSGNEIEAQFGVMAALLPRVDRLAVLASRGDGPGLPEQGEARSETYYAAESTIRAFRSSYPDKVIAASPGDFAYADSLSRISRNLDAAGTILWSGPARLEEYATDPAAARGKPLAAHEKALHRALRRSAFAVVCSEEEKQFAYLGGQGFHLSTGPRAFLEYIERLSLPGITALDPSER